MLSESTPTISLRSHGQVLIPHRLIIYNSHPFVNQSWPTANLLPSKLPEEEGEGDPVLLTLNLQIRINLQIQAIVTTMALSSTSIALTYSLAAKASSKPPTSSSQPSISKPQTRKSNNSTLRNYGRLMRVARYYTQTPTTTSRRKPFIKRN